MDNDNKINEENLSLKDRNKIHQEVMLFLGDELENIHKSSKGQTYDIEKEYGKTKKNKSPFVALILTGCFVVVIGVSFMIHRIVSAKNSEIQVSLQKFDDLNLKGLLDTVSVAQSNYDNAIKTKATIEADMESKLKTANENYENEVFVLDSLKLSESQYNDRVEELKKQYNDIVTEIHKEFDESIAQAEKQIQEYKKQLAEFDTAKIEAAREQEKALNSERQLRKLETEKLTKEYEDRIAEINNSMQELRLKSNEEIRNTVKEVTNKYQAEIDTLDPKLNDENANSIIQEAGMYEVYNFDGKNLFAESEIDSEIIENAVNVYQNIYDEYDYIDKTVASIPQKNSIPEYVKTSRTLVNAMGKTFYTTAMSLYDETVELNQEIEYRNEQIEEKNQEIKKINEDFALERENFNNELLAKQEEFEETLAFLMGVQNTSAIVSGINKNTLYLEENLTEEEIQQEIQVYFDTKMAELEAQKENAWQNYLAQKNENNNQTETSETETSEIAGNESESENESGSENENEGENENENEELPEQQESDELSTNNEDLENESSEQEFVFEMPSEEEILEQARAQVPLTKTVTKNLTEIEIFVAPRAHYLITEDGAKAEIKTANPIKGKIIKTDDEKFVFEISPDKNGNIPAVNFEEINKGTPVKILSK